MRRADIALRHSGIQAAIDGIPPEIDPALSLDTPFIQVQVQLAPGLFDCTIPVWAGDEVQEIEGPFRLGSTYGLRMLGDELLWPLLPGQGLFYLTRSKGCGPPGSYNVRNPSQVQDRDPGIQVSAGMCP